MISLVGPGLMLAASGVGAGDLAGGAFAGMHLGTAVLWAVVVGAFFKYVITEGLARWQLATGTTLLEGAVLRLGRPVQWGFLVYLLIWTFGVGTSLISACGVATHGPDPWPIAKPDRRVRAATRARVVMACSLLVPCTGRAARVRRPRL